MRILIVGNGVTGYTAALRLREKLPDAEIAMISGESQYPFSRPALMYVYMGHMRFQDTKPFEDRVWKERRIELVHEWVVGVDASARSVTLGNGEQRPYDALVLAVGSRPNKFGWPGQDLHGVQGFYSLMDLAKIYDATPGAKRGVIVGGGLIGIELAEMLHSRGIEATLLVREASYWSNVLPAEESAMVNRAIQSSGMDLRLGSELGEVVDDGAGRACAVMTKAGERIECDIVGLTAGVSPNLDLAKDMGLEVGRGILVDRTLKASVDGVYAAGDCAEIVVPGAERNLIQQVWYTGKMQGEVVADVIAGEQREYDPGTWFNSAKFLDLEYQTYGMVFPKDAANSSVWWEHEDGKRGMRIVHNAGVVTGFNMMGLRYRHDVCKRWLEERASLDYVVNHLVDANFDPEFFPRFERQIQAAAGA